MTGRARSSLKMPPSCFSRLQDVKQIHQAAVTVTRVSADGENPALRCKQRITRPMLLQQGGAEDCAAWGIGCLAPKTLFLALNGFFPLWLLPRVSAQLGTEPQCWASGAYRSTVATSLEIVELGKMW